MNKEIEIIMIDNQRLTGIVKEIRVDDDGSINRKIEVTSEGNLKGKEIDISEKEVFLVANIG